MVFHFIAGILHLITSSLAFILAAIVFSSNLGEMAAFAAALVILTILIGILRLFFAPRGKGILHSMMGMKTKGYSVRRTMMRFRETMEREIIADSTARGVAFAAIIFLAGKSMMVSYIAAAIGIGTGIIMLMVHRHHFSDVFLGIILGVGIAYISWIYSPLLLAAIGI